ncbi:uncharacterized protein LOC135475917 [Liolophura sinensis]|uniref:uncharacterized protein LOC135475917 n=1 Tax=Liolophura sinensis TaxID=3198878 RepID=UPI00315962BD
MLKFFVAVALTTFAYVSAQNCDGCVDEDGSCKGVSEVRMSITEDKSFCAYEKCKSNGNWQLFQYKCYYEPSDTCMNQGDSISTGVCSEVVCTQTDSGATFRDERINGCEDSSGTCQPVGATGFSYVFKDGRVGDNCECQYVEEDGEMKYKTSCGGM